MTQINIYLVRHGKTIYNQTGRVQGWKDSPLTEEGLVVAKRCGYGLRDIPFDMAYSSDLNRAAITTKVILEENHKEDIPFIIDRELREISFGHFDGGLNEDRIAASAKVLFGEEHMTQLTEKLSTGEIRGRDMLNATYSIDESGYAETFEMVQERAVKAIKRIFAIADKNGFKNVLVVSHGVTIASIIDYFPGEKIEQISDVKNASVSLLTNDQEKIRVNQVSSLEFVEKGKELE